jgi:hypothetical protein
VGRGIVVKLGKERKKEREREREREERQVGEIGGEKKQ